MNFYYEEIDKLYSNLELNKKLDEIDKNHYEQCLQYITNTKDQIKGIENAINNGSIAANVGEQQMLGIVTNLKVQIDKIIKIGRKHKKNKRKVKNVMTFFIVLVGLGAVVGGVFLVKLIKHQNIAKEHSVTVQTLRRLPLPKQQVAYGRTKIEHDNKKAEITYLASYTLYGRVMSTYEHTSGDHNYYESMWPKDICVAYGELAGYADQFKWSSDYNRDSGARMCWVRYERSLSPDSSLLSNNHLIPADENIRELIMNIQVGDYVKLDGYLAEMRIGDMDITSSLSRDDTTKTEFGKKIGNCEIMYVTNVNWLTEKEN